VERASPPASRIEAGSIFSRNDIVDGSTHTDIPEGASVTHPRPGLPDEALAKSGGALRK